MNVIIFSKDRAPQLDLLLRSIERNFYKSYNQNVTVVFKASSKEYEDGYRKLIKLYGRKEKQTGYISWINEDQTPFKEASLSAINLQKSMTMFLVDDIVFTHNFSIHDDEFTFFQENEDILGLSLRLDSNKTYCYAIDKEMTVPKSIHRDHFCFPWMIAEGDFGYPMSVDGTIFRTDEILPLMKSLNYWNPNTFEASLSQNPIKLPYLLAYPKAKLVNIPANRTQNTFQNRHANLEEAELSKLNALFLEGLRIDLKPFDGLETPSVHFEMNYEVK